MKVLLTLTLVFYSVNGFSFLNIFSQNEEISSLAASCVGIPDGTRLPDETDCKKFTLCDGGVGLSLSCRLSDPYFYRCNSSCVNKIEYCDIKDCSGASSTTVSSTTTVSITTTSQSVTTTSTTKAPDTTTKYIVPTVPIGCTPSCAITYNTTVCPCIERWVCVNKVCECSANLTCPVTRAVCEGTTADGCGCSERCDCTGTAPDEKCFCKADVICPFDKVNCATVCGCAEQCDDSVCKESTVTPGTFTCTACNTTAQCSFTKAECASKCGCANNCDCPTDTTCTCKPVCECIEPPVVCPFKPEDCVTRCGCEKRCENTCNGNFCVCDPAVRCT